MKTRYYYLALSLFLCFSLVAQKKSTKYGKLDKADLLMTHYPLDSSAHAVVLSDVGYAELVYEETAGKFFIKFERHTRIKVIDEAGYQWANIEIPLYKSGRDKEKLTKFKGIVYNLNRDKVEETSISRKAVINDDLNEYFDLAKVAMPQITKGCVFEVIYATRSPFIWNLQDWRFQGEIPVRYSEFEVRYPEWFQYDKKMKGYDYNYLTVNEEDADQVSINYNSFSRSEGYNTKSSGSTKTLEYRRMINKWASENMPAFHKEAHISSVNNYLVAIDFELAAIKFPNSNFQSFIGDWEKVGSELMESDRLGKMLSKGQVKSVKEQTLAVIEGQTDEFAKIVAIRYFILQNINWDGVSTVYAKNHSMSKLLDSKKGNVADLNLLMIAMLKSAGINANPVVLSTRENGFLNPFFPSRRQFDYIICHALTADGKTILLDATDPSLSTGLLPLTCINDKGLLLKDTGTEWVSLAPNGRYQVSKQCKLKMTEAGDLEGTLGVVCKDYAAQTVRKAYAKADGKEGYLLTLQQEFEGLEIKDGSLTDFENIEKPTKETYEITIKEQMIAAGDLLYFNPMLLFAKTENPFKLEERKYPVDFSHPIREVYSAQIEIPDTYTIAEMPEKLVGSLPEKGGKIMFSVTANGNILNVVSQFQINKHLYLPEEYAALKQFYALVIEKQAAQIVLKRKT